MSTTALAPDTALTAGERIARALDARFGTTLPVAPDQPGAAVLAGFLEHNTHRRYTGAPVSDELLQLLYAAALSSPSKSDLQQAGILRVADPAKRAVIADLLPSMPWVREAPVFLVFIGDNRRLRKVSGLRGHAFANDHLDAFFNAAVDAGIVLGAFIHAANAAGLGTCPISAIRNHARTVSDLLGLPEHVFPVAGLTLGYPFFGGRIVPRLPLELNVHDDRYDDAGLAGKIDAWDRHRAARLPYPEQQDTGRFGIAAFYGWSEDKARQYATPARADFGAYVREQGFDLS
ncbi:nitroreductase [Opitutaceae bacterium TAV5]|nr:nitroreductase [Opitutaceae bacterium TAV5]